jgi:hypothetical protein
MGPETKNDCAGEGQQQITALLSAQTSRAKIELVVRDQEWIVVWSIFGS